MGRTGADGCYRGRYRDANERVRTVRGTFTSKREALKAARDEEAKLRAGTWFDPRAGRMKFSTYFETMWLPAQTKELSTLASYESAYKKHFEPTFGRRGCRTFCRRTFRLG